MIYIFLTILCSTSIGLILKFSDTRKGNPILLLSANYFIASLISFIFMIRENSFTFSCQTFIFGALLGILFVLAFFIFAKAVGSAGAALSSVSSRISVIIPITLSILIFNEEPNHYQLIGFFFTVVTIILFYFSVRGLNQGNLHFSDYFYLFALLAGIGINDFCMKVFQDLRPENEKALFLFSIFTFAFIYTISIILYKKIPFERKTIYTGLILGIPNIFSSYFLLAALAGVSAIVVYPVVNIGVILLTTFGAILLWKEKIGFFGFLSLLSGMVAIFLLSFK